MSNKVTVPAIFELFVPWKPREIKKKKLYYEECEPNLVFKDDI